MFGCVFVCPCVVVCSAAAACDKWCVGGIGIGGKGEVAVVVTVTM